MQIIQSSKHSHTCVICSMKNISKYVPELKNPAFCFTSGSKVKVVNMTVQYIGLTAASDKGQTLTSDYWPHDCVQLNH